MRALAILWVMPFHFRFAMPSALHGVARTGWMGVDLFFVLSGYLIGSQLLRPYLSGNQPSLGGFYMRRALRVLPAFLRSCFFILWCLPFAKPLVFLQSGSS